MKNPHVNSKVTTPISKTSTQLKLDTILENDNFSVNVKNRENISETSLKF